ncbi:hypothetical protein HYW39_01560 [Candidatus Curtissbacteria bacterium]|nr:hypothetical protein [Candidatus Curtissbacteria bacterium]
MKNGFIGVIIVIIVLSGAGYFIFKNYSKTPNPQTQKTAQSIVKYPKVATWEPKERKNLCFFATDECSQPVTISFTSQASWPEIYNFYIEIMKENGWTTNSQVFTQTPQGAVFKKDNCEADLKNNSKNKAYSIAITCPEKS